MKAFVIYPTDKVNSTKFLNRINTHAKRELNEMWHCYKVKFSDNDHERCLTEASLSPSKLIIFMGHGTSYSLAGSCASEDNSFISEEALELNPQSFYNKQDFINASNIDFLKSKILLSLSCLSNRNDKKSIGRNAIEKGISSFIGFGDIPTDFISQNNFPKKAIAVFKGKITKIIKNALCASIKFEYNVQELVDLIKILTNKEIQNLLIVKKGHRHKGIIVKHLYLFKSEIIILGNKFEKIT